MVSLSLLQGIFPTQELNWGLLHFRQIPYQLSYPAEAQKYVNHRSWRREVKAECKQREAGPEAQAYIRVHGCRALESLGYGQIGQFKPKERGYGKPPSLGRVGLI